MVVRLLAFCFLTMPSKSEYTINHIADLKS